MFQEDESARATQLPHFYREVDVVDTGDSATEVSQQQACGEGTMKSFIKSNLSSILKPFADHVDDLQKTVNKVNSSLLKVAAKQRQHSESLDDYNEKISSLQTELNCTSKLADSTQVALEVLTAEKQMFADEYAKTKVDLKNADERIVAAQFTIAELQTGLKGARTSVGKLREPIRKMEQDITSRIWTTIEQLIGDVRKLDMAHSDTEQSVHDTKLFMDNFHQAFQIFEEENDQRNTGHDRKFQQVEDSFTKLERTLKDMQDDTHLQSEHLNKIDGVVGPLKVRLHNLEIAREEGKRRLNEHDLIITDLKVVSRTMGVDVAKLIEFYEEAKSTLDLFGLVGSLERMLAQNHENIRNILETTEDHTSGLRKSNNRTTNLEKALNKLQEQTGRLMDHVGMPTAESAIPSDEPHDRSQMAFNRLQGAQSAASGAAKMPSAVLRAIDKMSLNARQKRIHETVQDHGDELARSKTDLAKTATHVENTEHRVSLLENQMKVTQDDVKNIRSSLDLSQDYWKGLSRGFKDTNAEVNQDGKVLPPRANLVRLPAMVCDSSC